MSLQGGNSMADLEKIEIDTGKVFWEHGHEEWAEDCSVLGCNQPGEMRINGKHFCEDHFVGECCVDTRILGYGFLKLFRALERRDLL
jgi:hypothetical protein